MTDRGDPGTLPDATAERGERGWKAGVWGLFAAGVVLTLAIVAAVPDEVFYSGDAGVKALLVKQFAQGNWKPELELPAPAPVLELWKSGQYPLTPPFVYETSRGYSVAFPFAFALLSTPFYELLGFRGFYAVPLLSLWLLWALFIRTLERLRLPARAVALGFAALAFASHLTLYGAMFWEHTLGALLAYLGIDYAVRRDAAPLGSVGSAAAGVLFGTSFLIRSEALLLVVLVTAYCLLTRSRRRTEHAFAGGAALGLLLVAGVNLAVYGRPLGLHGEQVLHAATPVSLALFFAERGARISANLLLHAPFAVFAVVVAAGSVKTAGWDVRKWPIGVLAPCLLFLLGLPFGTPNAGGRQLGPRYTLVVVAPFALVTAVAFAELVRRRPRGHRALLGLLALCCALGFVKNGVLNARHLVEDYRSRITSALALVRSEPGKVVAVSDTAVAQELEATFATKSYVLALTPADTTRALGAAAALGDATLLFASFADAPPPPIPAETKTTDLGRRGPIHFYRLAR